MSNLMPPIDSGETKRSNRLLLVLWSSRTVRAAIKIGDKKSANVEPLKVLGDSDEKRAIRATGRIRRQRSESQDS